MQLREGIGMIRLHGVYITLSHIHSAMHDAYRTYHTQLRPIYAATVCMCHAHECGITDAQIPNARCFPESLVPETGLQVPSAVMEAPSIHLS